MEFLHTCSHCSSSILWLQTKWSSRVLSVPGHLTISSVFSPFFSTIFSLDSKWKCQGQCWDEENDGIFFWEHWEHTTFSSRDLMLEHQGEWRNEGNDGNISWEHAGLKRMMERFFWEHSEHTTFFQLRPVVGASRRTKRWREWWKNLVGTCWDEENDGKFFWEDWENTTFSS